VLRGSHQFSQVLFLLASFFGLGVTLLILACVLTDGDGHHANAWPLLIGKLARLGSAFS